MVYELLWDTQSPSTRPGLPPAPVPLCRGVLRRDFRIKIVVKFLVTEACQTSHSRRKRYTSGYCRTVETPSLQSSKIASFDRFSRSPRQRRTVHSLFRTTTQVWGRRVSHDYLHTSSHRDRLRYDEFLNLERQQGLTFTLTIPSQRRLHQSYLTQVLFGHPEQAPVHQSVREGTPSPVVPRPTSRFQLDFHFLGQDWPGPSHWVSFVSRVMFGWELGVKTLAHTSPKDNKRPWYTRHLKTAKDPLRREYWTDLKIFTFSVTTRVCRSQSDQERTSTTSST